MGLKTEIWAWRLGGGGGKKEEDEEKIPHMCESIGHRPLRGRCPKSVKKLIIPPLFSPSTTSGSNSSLEAGTAAPRLQPQPRGSNPSLMTPLQPRGSNSSLNAQILAQHRSSAPLGPLPLSPSHLTYPNLGATGIADHLKNGDRPTDQPTDGQTKRVVESCARD